MHVTLIEPEINARLAETVVPMGDFYRFTDHAGLATVAAVWTSQIRGKVCEILRHEDKAIPSGKNEQYFNELMSQWFSAITTYLGAEHLQLGETIYGCVISYEKFPEYLWDQWSPVQVACHDPAGLIFRKIYPQPGLVGYRAVDKEFEVLDGLEHFKTTGKINDDLKGLLVRHGQDASLRYYPLPLVLRGVNTGRRTPAEHRKPGRSRPPMTWLRYKRRTVLELIPQPK